MAFTLAAPTATKYADFSAPDPLTFAKSPDYQYVLDAQQKALEHSAAARGSYFTPNTMFSLQGNAAGLASGEYDKAFGRALQTYDTNRDTAHQFFGDQRAQFGDNLNAFQANTAATQGDRQFSLAGEAAKRAADQTAYDRSIYADQTAYDRGTGPYAGRASTAPAMPWVDPYAAQNAAESARLAGPMSLAGSAVRKPVVLR